MNHLFLVVFFWAILQPLVFTDSAFADNDWTKIDRRLKKQIYQINVGLKLHLKDSSWAHLADLSPKLHYPVFCTTEEDKGFRVIGFGTTFPVKNMQTGKILFITNKHVLDNADPITKECERFFAGMYLLAEQTQIKNSSVDKRYHQLMGIVNLAAKKDLTASERTIYQSTVDSIWDTYETYLSQSADPARLLFTKYLKQVPIKSQTSYFIHPPGLAKTPALTAHVYKVASLKNDPDLALLSVDNDNILPLEFDTQTPCEGQEIQVIGYPAASDQIDIDAAKYYAPTFNTGRISRVAPRMLQVDAPITNGLSGGPVISQRGKVLGIVAVRALSEHGGELPNFGGAITIQSVQSFAPELFRKSNPSYQELRRPKNMESNK